MKSGWYYEDGGYAYYVSGSRLTRVEKVEGYYYNFGADGINVGQQRRKKFAFSYQTREGNDVDDEASYKIHICYGCSCSPSSKDYNTINDSPDAIEFSWDYECTPVAVAGHKPTATVVIDSSVVDSIKLGKIEKALYGDLNAESTLLLPAQIITTMNAQ